MIALLALSLFAANGVQLPASPQATPPAAPQTRVQSGVSVRPDTVTVGDPFIVLVRVRAPRGAMIAFPDLESGEGFQEFEAVDPREVVQATDTMAVEQTARYRWVAWRPGEHPLPLSDAIVRAGGRDQRIAIGGTTVLVRSVLPADTALHVPKEVRDIMAPLRPLWLYWLALAVALVLIALLWWYLRRRRRDTVDSTTAFERAEREFDRIETLRLIEAGERGRYVALMVEVLRDYFADRFPAAPRSLTSWELLQVVHDLRVVPAGKLERVLREVDLVKFARHPITMDRARELGRETRAIVRDVERAARAADEARAAAEAKRAAHDAPREAA